MTGLAEVQRAEVADGVGAVFAPPHTAALESIGNHCLAGALHGAGADLPTIGQIAWVVHAMPMVLEVTHTVGAGGAGRGGTAAELKLFERSQHTRASFVLELVTPGAHTLLAQRLVVGPERQAQFG